MQALELRYAEVQVHPEKLALARSYCPMFERQLFGRSILLFQATDREKLAAVGEVRTPSLADLFVAVMSGGAGEGRGAA
jgi:ABC-2 type transport system ATP-binding protein